ncbi:hypothetical protein [Flavobacterium flavipallidum]|uniref:Uncharacterized protein n=1 Tax=Flavobacterium flavipallidum TaxID=3139140 RepID=A0ABU9HKM8_9FLAO
MKFSEFKNKEGKKLGRIMEFFQLMEREKLVIIDHNKCILTEFGKKIVENGGWFKHLEEKQKKEDIKKNNSELTKQVKPSKKKKNKSLFIAKKSFSLLTHHLKKVIKKKKI